MYRQFSAQKLPRDPPRESVDASVSANKIKEVETSKIKEVSFLQRADSSTTFGANLAPKVVEESAPIVEGARALDGEESAPIEGAKTTNEDGTTQKTVGSSSRKEMSEQRSGEDSTVRPLFGQHLSSLKRPDGMKPCPQLLKKVVFSRC